MVSPIFSTWYPYTDTRELHIAGRPLPSFFSRGHHLWLSTELGSLSQPSNILHRVHDFSHSKQSANECANECLFHCLPYGPTQLWSLDSHRIPILCASSLGYLGNMHLEKYEHTRTRTGKNTQYPTPGASSDLRICSCLFQDIKNIIFS